VNAEQSLRHSFTETLELPPAAVDWLCELWNAIQVLDDVADGDTIERADLDRAIFALLGGMPSNPFYQQHQNWLLPALVQMVMKWMASDIAEREGCADERSYMWRAGYYDVVCLIANIVHGPSKERSWQALSLYGEACSEYMKEFSNA
jgi:hypothetical protein